VDEKICRNEGGGKRRRRKPHQPHFWRARGEGLKKRESASSRSQIECRKRAPKPEKPVVQVKKSAKHWPNCPKRKVDSGQGFEKGKKATGHCECPVTRGGEGFAGGAAHCAGRNVRRTEWKKKKAKSWSKGQSRVSTDGEGEGRPQERSRKKIICVNASNIGGGGKSSSRTAKRKMVEGELGTA